MPVLRQAQDERWSDLQTANLVMASQPVRSW